MFTDNFDTSKEYVKIEICNGVVHRSPHGLECTDGIEAISMIGASNTNKINNTRLITSL